MAESRLCTIPGCDKPARSKGADYCEMHYYRNRRWGSPYVMKRDTPSARPEVCEIEGCSSPGYAKGCCLAHYTRLWRHGDALAGGTSTGEPMRWLLEHASYSGNDCLPWPFAIGRGGYGVIEAESGQMSAPKMMCTVVAGPPPTDLHETAHSCGKGHEGCINPRHLRWATRAENHADKHIHGTMPIGEAHHRAKLTEDQVREIRTLSGKELATVVARRYGVSDNAVRLIWSGRNWGWLP